MSNYLTDQQVEEIVDKVISKVWERILMWAMVVFVAFILVSLELNKAKADEAITPSEFKDAIVNIPSAVSEFGKSEWEKTKEVPSRVLGRYESTICFYKKQIKWFL